MIEPLGLSGVEDLRDAEIRFRALLESLPAVTYIQEADEQGLMSYVSPQVESVLGYTREEFIADSLEWMEMVHPDDLESVREADRRSDETGEPYEIEFRYRRKDGRYIWVHSRSTLVRDPNGAPLFWQGFFLDISAERETEDAMRDSERLHRQMFERNGAMMLLIDPDTTRIVDANPAAVSFYGYTIEQFRQLRLSDVNTASPKEITDAVEQLRRGGSKTFRFRHRLSSGELRDVQVDTCMVEVGDRPYVYSIVHDVTQERRAQEKFRRLVEHHPAVSYAESIDGDPGIVYMSPQVEAMLGYSPEAFADRDFWASVIHPEDRDLFLAENSLADSTLESFDMEYRMIATDGRVVWIKDLASLVRDEDDRRIWQGFLLDITAQRAAEERFRALVEQLPAATNVHTETEAGSGVYSLEYMSPQIEQILGHPLGDWYAIGSTKMLDRVVDPRDRQRVREADEHAEAAGDPFHIEYRAVARDGRVVWIADEGVRVDPTPGAPRQWLGVMTDITERKRAEEDLRKSFELLREADQERRQLLERIVRAQEEERRRVASEIHDDPIQKMTAIGLRIDSLRRYVHDPEGVRQLDDFAGTVSEAIARLRSLLFELHPPALDEAGLAAALRDALDEFEQATGIVADLQDDLASEPDRDARSVIYRIVQEALANVRKHARASNVSVKLAEQAGGVMVRVRDDGVGFDRAAAGERGHLGLVSMRERAEMMGGRIRLDSSLGTGTTVEAWVPGGSSEPGAPDALEA